MSNFKTKGKFASDRMSKEINKSYKGNELIFLPINEKNHTVLVDEKNDTMMVNIKKHEYISIRSKIEKGEVFLRLLF